MATTYSICPSTYVEINLTPAGGTGPYTITGITAGSIPSGMNFSLGAVATPLLFGTCSVSGSYSFTVSIYDAGLSLTTSSDVIVVVNKKIGLDLKTIPVIRYGEIYHHILRVLVENRAQNEFTVAIPIGTLPTGIVFTATAGSPSLTGETSEEGVFQVTFSVTDNVSGCVVYQEYIFIVNRLYLDINLPCTKPGLPYKIALAAGGGIYPYRYHIRANYVFPNDLMLDTYTGLLHGSVYTEGVYVLGIRIFDARNDYIDKDLTLVCSKECLPTTFDWLPSAQSIPVTVGEHYFESNLKRFLPSIFEV